MNALNHSASSLSPARPQTLNAYPQRHLPMWSSIETSNGRIFPRQVRYPREKNSCNGITSIFGAVQNNVSGLSYPLFFFFFFKEVALISWTMLIIVILERGHDMTWYSLVRPSSGDLADVSWFDAFREGRCCRGSDRVAVLVGVVACVY